MGKATDAALVIGAALRLTRLVTTDSLGEWWIKDPIDRAMRHYEAKEMMKAEKLDEAYGMLGVHRGAEHYIRQPRWWKYRSGLDCPFCIGHWVGAAVLGSYLLARRLPAPVLSGWRFGAAALAMNYVVGHVSAKLDEGDDNG